MKILLMFLLLFSTAAISEVLNLASWNIRNISSNSRSDAELGIISVILARYDFIAIQEIRTDTKSLDRLVKILKDEFRLDYSYVASGKISCDKPLRSCIFLGARAVVSKLKNRPAKTEKERWLKALIERRGVNCASMALANKTARTAYALLKNNTDYKPVFIAA